MRNNELNDQALLMMSQTLPPQALNQLTHFLLEENDLTTIMNFQPLLSVLRNSSNLIALSLRGGEIPARQMRGILTSLEHNSHLRYLNLSRNFLDPEGCITLCQIVQNNTQLTALSLQKSGLGRYRQDHIMRHLGLLQQTCPHLRYIWLDTNFITDSMLGDLINPTGNSARCNLAYLSLSNNLLQEAEIFQNAADIDIQTLILNGNPFLISGISNLALYLEWNGRLIDLDLSRCKLTVNHGRALREGLSRNSSLQRLNLSKNQNLGEESLEILKTMMTHLTLRYLNLYKSIEDFLYEADEIVDNNNEDDPKIVILEVEDDKVENLESSPTEFVPEEEKKTSK